MASTTKGQTMNDEIHTDADIEARARRRVAMRTGFYTHALVFVLVNLGLFVMNTMTGGYRWSNWPLFGWGLGLAIHGLTTYLNLRGEGWKQRMLAQEIEHLKRNRP
jgi:hypothetical protein